MYVVQGSSIMSDFVIKVQVDKFNVLGDALHEPGESTRTAAWPCGKRNGSERRQ